MRALAITVLVACGAPPAKTAVDPTPPVGNLAARVDPYCAPIPGLGPWHAEVFPACPPRSIGDYLYVCEPGACPTPCHVHSDIGDDMGTGMYSSSWNHAYDERGRWIRTSSDDDTPDPEDVSTCTYDGDRIARCTLNARPATAQRDASGRIARVTIGDESVAVTYGANGEVVSVGESTLRYDERGRLAAFTLAGPNVHRRWTGDYVLARDARGRVVTETKSARDDATGLGGEARTFAYDARNRVVSVVTRHLPWKLSSELPPTPQGPDAVTSAGAPWSEDSMCLDCPDGAVDDAPKDPDTERREMLASIESSATSLEVIYDGDTIVVISSGEKGPQRRFRHFSYDCQAHETK